MLREETGVYRLHSCSSLLDFKLIMAGRNGKQPNNSPSSPANEVQLSLVVQENVPRDAGGC